MKLKKLAKMCDRIYQTVSNVRFSTGTITNLLYRQDDKLDALMALGIDQYLASHKDELGSGYAVAEIADYCGCTKGERPQRRAQAILAIAHPAVNKTAITVVHLENASSFTGVSRGALVTEIISLVGHAWHSVKRFSNTLAEAMINLGEYKTSDDPEYLDFSLAFNDYWPDEDEEEDVTPQADTNVAEPAQESSDEAISKRELAEPEFVHFLLVQVRLLNDELIKNGYNVKDVSRYAMCVVTKLKRNGIIVPTILEFSATGINKAWYGGICNQIRNTIVDFYETEQVTKTYVSREAASLAMRDLEDGVGADAGMDGPCDFTVEFNTDHPDKFFEEWGLGTINNDEEEN